MDRSKPPTAVLHISNLPPSVSRNRIKRYLEELCPGLFLDLTMLPIDRPSPSRVFVTVRRSDVQRCLATLNGAFFLDQELIAREEPGVAVKKKTPGERKEREADLSWGLQLYITGVHPDVSEDELAEHIRQCCPGTEPVDVMIKQGRGMWKEQSGYGFASWKPTSIPPDPELLDGTTLQGLRIRCHLQDNKIPLLNTRPSRSNQPSSGSSSYRPVQQPSEHSSSNASDHRPSSSDDSGNSGGSSRGSAADQSSVPKRRWELMSVAAPSTSSSTASTASTESTDSTASNSPSQSSSSTAHTAYTPVNWAVPVTGQGADSTLPRAPGGAAQLQSQPDESSPSFFSRPPPPLTPPTLSPPLYPVAPPTDGPRVPRDRAEAGAWLAEVIPQVQKAQEEVAELEERLRASRHQLSLLQEEEKKLLTCIMGNFSAYHQQQQHHHQASAPQAFQTTLPQPPMSHNGGMKYVPRQWARQMLGPKEVEEGEQRPSPHSLQNGLRNLSLSPMQS